MVNTPGTYWVQAGVNCGYTRTDTIVVANAPDLPAMPSLPDTTICQGTYYSFSLPFGPSYLLNGSPNASNSFLLGNAGEYIISAQNRCYTQDVTFTIYVETCETKVYVTSAFTPDGDGLNECFAPVMTNIKPNSYEIYIADRWGNIVFATQDPNTCWNGQNKGGQVIGAVYTYRRVYRDHRGLFTQKTGTVTVLL